MKRVAATCALVIAGIFSTVQASQTLEAVIADREAKLGEALERLERLRETIRTERLPRVRELNAWDVRVGELEAELTTARRLRERRSVDLETLRAEVEERQGELDLLTRTLLPEAVADYQASLTVGERPLFGEAVREYHLFLEEADASATEKLERGLALLDASAEQIEGRLGGKRYPGGALVPEGTVEPGTFVQMGPLLYFANEEATLAGPVGETRALSARLLPFRGNQASAILAVAKEGRGRLPVDPSLGDAATLERTKDTILEHLIKGGVWVAPILLFALVATLVAVCKSIQIFRIRHPQPGIIHGIVKSLRENRPGAARETASAQPEPARGMLVAAVEHAGESTEMVEEVMYESMLTTQPRLERFLNVIAVTAAAAPLLGLLGTVTGIIKTFGLMTIFGAGDPRPLISGISEALITTELGLIVAIPALVMHALLSRKVAGTMARMERTAVTFVNGLSRIRALPSQEER